MTAKEKLFLLLWVQSFALIAWNILIIVIEYIKK